MKVRVRIQGVTKTVSLGDGGAKDFSFAVLKQKVTTELGLNHESFDLSLNKKDILEGEEKVLDDFGIVSGDLIHVLVQGGASTCQPREVTPTSQPIQREATPPSSATSTMFTSTSNEESRSDTSATCTNVDQSSAARDAAVDDDPMEGTSNMGGSYNMDGNSKSDPVVNRCLQEPLHCCESTTYVVPVLLAQLYESVHCEDQNDLLWVVIHTLMLEAGFKPTQGDDSGGSMPDQWRQPTLYNTRYRLPESNGVVSSVTGVVMGSFLIVHGYIVGNEMDSCTYKVILKPSEYLTGDTKSGPAKCYKNLKQISRNVKNHVGLPLLKDMRTVLGYPEGINLLSLTHELKLRILGFLDCASLLKMDRTCHHFHSLARDRAVWRRRYLLDFGSRGNNSLSLNWYELYKSQYRSRKEAQKAMRDMTFLTPGQVWMQQHPQPPFAPLAPYNGGILGGDYDLNPQFQGIPDPLGRRGRNPLQPLLPQPRFDPFGPLPDHNILPGRGRRRGGGHGGLGRGRGWMGGFGGGPGRF